MLRGCSLPGHVRRLALVVLEPDMANFFGELFHDPAHGGTEFHVQPEEIVAVAALSGRPDRCRR
ncbi:hypothetical protein QK292_19500, partial [Arthrobacter sp. AL08]|nr:hypothetical protein [Arthrobacter sp. AL08]